MVKGSVAIEAMRKSMAAQISDPKLTTRLSTFRVLLGGPQQISVPQWWE
jgi:hypothetical protein